MGQAKKETNGMLQVQKIRKFFARYLISCDKKKSNTIRHAKGMYIPTIVFNK
jgi:hypothetical protein